MDVKKLTLGMVGIMICAVMIGGALLPAVASATDETRVELNNTSGILSLAINDNMSFSYESGRFYVNGVDSTAHGYATYLVSDVLNLKGSGTSVSITLIDNGTLVSYFATTLTVTTNNNTMTVIGNGGEHENTVSYEWLYYVDVNGTYRVSGLNNDSVFDVYINDINDLIVVSTRVTGGYATYKGGEIKSNLENVTANYTITDLPEYDDIDKIILSNDLGETDFKFVLDGADYPGSSYIVPYKIVGHNSGMTVIDSMYSVIPIIAVAGLVLAGIYVFISRK